MENLTGKQFGPYRIVGPLGEGGMASVYRAYQASVERYVALKVLPSYFARDPEYVGRFENEAKVLAKLQHPHILPVHDFGEAEGFTYIVMPFVKGGGLNELLARGQLSLSQITHIIGQIASALDYAHSCGVVHRDVKPSNVLIDQQGNCLLTDFGIAKIVGSTVAFTQTGGVIGTPAYMSPEQIRGETLDGRSDIYSLGVILYEMTAGKTPFRAETPPAVFVKHLLDPLPPPHIHNPDIPAVVEGVILKALSKDREDRYPRANDLAQALRAAVARSQPDSTSPTPISPSPLPRARSRLEPTEHVPPISRPRFRLTPWMWGALVVAILAIVAVGIGGVLLLRNRVDDRLAALDETPVFQDAGQDTEIPLAQSGELQNQVSVAVDDAALPGEPVGIPFQLLLSSSSDYASVELLDVEVLSAETLDVGGSPSQVEMEGARMSIEQEYDRVMEASRVHIIQSLTVSEFMEGNELVLALDHGCRGQVVVEVYNVVTGRPRLVNRMVSEGEDGCSEVKMMTVPVQYLTSTELPAPPTPIPTEPPAVALVYQAQELYDDGQFEEAMARLDQAEEMGLDEARLYELRAEVCHEWYYAGGPCELERIIADLSMAILLEPEDGGLYSERAWILHELGDIPGALENLGMAISFNPQDPYLYSARADIFRDLEDFSAALEDSDRSIEIDPENTDFLHGRAWTYAEMGEWDQAIADLDRAIKLAPEDGWNWYDRGQVQLQAGDTTGGIDDLNHAIELDPRNMDFFIARAWAYRDTGDLDAAIADFSRVLELDGEFYYALHDRGWTFFEVGDLDAARADFEKFVRVTAGNGEFDEMRVEDQHWLDTH